MTHPLLRGCMRWMRVDASAVVCAVFVLVAACSETPPAVSARHEVPPDKPAPPRQNLAKQARKPGAPKGKTDTEPDTPTLPQECAGGGERCFPPPEFVREICRGKHLSVALAMFKRSAPWEHVFVQVRDVAAVNQLGGPVGDPRLVYSEEVILLQHRPYVPRDGFDMKAPEITSVMEQKLEPIDRAAFRRTINYHQAIYSKAKPAAPAID